MKNFIEEASEITLLYVAKLRDHKLELIFWRDTIKNVVAKGKVR